jgi:hypothetical protein
LLFLLNLLLYINDITFKISVSFNDFFIILTKYLINIVVLTLAHLFLSTVLIEAQKGSDTAGQYLQTNAPFAGSPRYNKILTDAMILQNRIDSLEREAEGYRQEIMYMDNVTERNRLQFHLGILEEEIKAMQTEADSLFNVLSGMKDFKVDYKNLLILDTIIEGIKVYKYNLEKFNQRDSSEKYPAEKPESSNFFSISKRTIYSPDNPFEHNFTIPSGVFYRIQMAAISQPAGWEQFGGIQPVTVETDNDRKLIKYFAGKFTEYSTADSALVRVRAAGFRDAFIVGYYNGNRMSTEQVREFEKSKR